MRAYGKVNRNGGKTAQGSAGLNGGLRNENRLRAEDSSAHDWYRFVLSFPPHLVRSYLERFGIGNGHLVLDPFCGTGTTLVESKKVGVKSIGIEANPMAYFASRVKVNWAVDPAGLLKHANQIGARALEEFEKQGLDDDELPLFRRSRQRVSELRTLPADVWKLLLSNSISPLPLHKTLIVLDSLRQDPDPRYIQHELLALAKAVVFGISNLEFGPEVGVGPPKTDAPVVGLWLHGVEAMARDLAILRANASIESRVVRADSRRLSSVLAPDSVSAVITSPPYPNEKDYTRTTRLESVLLGLIRSKHHLRSLKQNLVRSNTRSVYKTDSDDELIANHREIQRIAAAIEARRIELGKTSGFERLYARVTKLYFGGMARHLSDLRCVLQPGARLAYVVGDQASYLRVMIRTGQLLADIAQSLGYEVEAIDLFRTRLATATKEQLREEVVVLRWPTSSPAGESI